MTLRHLRLPVLAVALLLLAACGGGLGGSIAGDYSFRAEITDQPVGGPEARGTFHLKDDKTFTVEGEVDGSPVKESGTWKRDGGSMTLVRSGPGNITWKGTIADDVIRVSFGELTLILRKKGG